MPDESTPEIDALRTFAFDTDQKLDVVDLDDAVQAVRETEGRCAAGIPAVVRIAREQGRSDMAREIVEALRFEDRSAEWQDIADYIESRFLP